MAVINPFLAPMTEKERQALDQELCRVKASGYGSVKIVVRDGRIFGIEVTVSKTIKGETTHDDDDDEQ